MNRFRAATLAIACTLCAAAAPAPLDAMPTRPDRDAAEVHRFFMEGIAHFNHHDIEPFLTQFDEQISMFAVSSWLRGKAALRERFASTFAAFPKARMEITNLRARSAGRNVVTVDFEFHTYPRGTGPAYHGVGSGAYIRTKAGWREVLEHESVTKRDAGF